MKRRVLILTPFYPHDASPASGIFIQDQAQVLSSDYDVTVLIPHLLGLRDLANRKPVSRSQTGSRNETVLWEGIFVPAKLPYFLRAHVYRRLVQRGFSKILSVWGKPDILHAHVVFPGGYLAVELGKTYGIPVVLTEHTGPFSVHLRFPFQRRAVRETLHQVDKILAVSPALQQQMHVFEPTAPIEVLGNVVMTDFFQPNDVSYEKSQNPGKTFLSVALMNKGKGIDYLLKSARILLNRGVSAFRLLIGGSGPDLPNLKELSSKLELDRHCRFLGMLERTEVREWMQKADVFVLPSLGESFGVAAGEAMACGKPVLSTRCGGPEFILTAETGVLVPVADPVAMADSMEKFISGKVVFDPQMIRESVVARFGERAFLKSISTVYDQLCKTADLRRLNGH
jgi:glycosyltransferase involved in cell wall biosynthesis